MTRRTTRTIIASVRSKTDICDLNSARATSDLLGSLTPHCGQRGASATKLWPHLRQAGRAILTLPVHGGCTVSIHGQRDYFPEFKATSPPQADLPREVENDVHVLSLLQEACGGASEAVRRERRPRMTDSTPSSRTRPVMADQKGA